MRRSEVYNWLEKNGGQKDLQIKYVEIDNPSPSAAERTKQPKIQVKQVTWEAGNGQRLTVLDTSNEDEQGPWASAGGVDHGDGLRGDPDYEVIAEGNPTDARTDSRSPEKKEADGEDAREARWNRDNGPGNPNGDGRGSGLYETHAQRAAREEQEKKSRQSDEDRARRDKLDEERNAIERDRLGLERDRANRAAQEEDRRSQNDSTRLQIERERFDFERDKANRPEIVSRPTDADEQIAVFNPATGKVEAQDNPLYNRAKTEAARKQEELALAIQHNRMTAEQAAAEYTHWFKENVELPFTQAAERRAQATEKRQALEAEERRRQFQSQHELERAGLGQRAADSMLDAEMALNPYRVGPKFGEQVSAATNSLAAGGTMDGPAANAGINFTADAFEYKKPNLSKIASKATAAALKNISLYKPLDENFDTADYTGITMPTPQIVSNAPTAPNLVDTGAMFQDWQATKYQGPST